MVEVWKKVTFDFGGTFTSFTRYEVSNLGRVRSFNKRMKGRILKGSLTEGYRVMHFKFLRVRTAEAQEVLDQQEEKLKKLNAEKKEFIATKRRSYYIEKTEKKIEKQKELLKKAYNEDRKKRTIYHQILIHRLVAKYFLPAPEKDEIVIGHLDYNKLNNKVNNLKWMTKDESTQHQKKSPYVIAEKEERKRNYKYRKNKPNAKLDSTKVMRIKILLKKGKTLKQIAREYNVSEMQISRIKRGENWGHIKI